MLVVKSQAQLNLPNSENTSFNTTNSRTTSSSPPLESDIPDTKLGLNHSVLVPLSQHISLIRGSKLPLCVARWCRGPANECTPVQNGVQWKCVKRQRHSKCCSSFQPIFFQLVSFPSASVTPILLWRVGVFTSTVYSVSVSISLSNVFLTGKPNRKSHVDISQSASVSLNSSVLMAFRSCTHNCRITCSLMKLHPVSLESWTEWLSNQRVEDSREFVLGISVSPDRD